MKPLAKNLFLSTKELAKLHCSFCLSLCLWCAAHIKLVIWQG